MPVKKAKAKQWFNIITPEILGGNQVGKTLTVDPNSLVGRKIIISAIELTEDFSKYYLKFILKIVKVSGTNALTEFYGIETMRDYVSRMILRRVRRIDTVQDITLKDGRVLRVKGLTVIGRRVKSSIQRSVQKKVSEMIKSFVEESTLEQFLEKIMSDEIKSEILQEIRDTYPVRNFEFRKVEVLK